MNAPDEICVIGGGAIGVCAAYFLAAQGQAVTLIEKDEIASGSSYGNAGLIVPGHSVPLAAPGVPLQGLKWLLNAESPFYIKPRLNPQLFRWLRYFLAACRAGPMQRGAAALVALNRASMRLFERLAAIDDLDFGFERRGALSLFTGAKGYEHGVREARLLRSLDVEVQFLDNLDAVRRIEPNVLSSIVGGLYFPQDAQLIPDRFVYEMARQAEQHGARIRTGTEVTDFEVSHRHITGLITTRGNFRPGHVVLAAGAWSPGIAGAVGLNLPVQAAKGYSITLNAPETSPRLPLYLSEKKVAVTPMGGSLRFAGTLELAGIDLSINQRRVAAIRRAASLYLPGMDDLEAGEVWCGLRPLTPDTLPMIGVSERFDNLTIATGHGMLGMSLAPITGKLVAQIVTGAAPDVDLTPLSPDRFSSHSSPPA